VPIFSYLGGELLAAAVARGVLDQRVEAYLDSFVGFAFPYLEEPELVEPLISSGSYETTESEVLASFSSMGASVTRGQGLSLVQEACRRLSEQVSSLRRSYDEKLQENAGDGGAENVVSIRDSPTVSAGSQPGHAADHHYGLRDASAADWTIEATSTKGELL
jgi:hypothetical protein